MDQLYCSYSTILTQLTESKKTLQNMYPAVIAAKGRVLLRSHVLSAHRNNEAHGSNIISGTLMTLK